MTELGADNDALLLVDALALELESVPDAPQAARASVARNSAARANMEFVMSCPCPFAALEAGRAFCEIHNQWRDYPRGIDCRQRVVLRRRFVLRVVCDLRQQIAAVSYIGHRTLRRCVTQFSKCFCIMALNT